MTEKKITATRIAHATARVTVFLNSFLNILHVGPTSSNIVSCKASYIKPCWLVLDVLLGLLRWIQHHLTILEQHI